MIQEEQKQYQKKEKSKKIRYKNYLNSKDPSYQYTHPIQIIRILILK